MVLTFGQTAGAWLSWAGLDHPMQARAAKMMAIDIILCEYMVLFLNADWNLRRTGTREDLYLDWANELEGVSINRCQHMAGWFMLRPPICRCVYPIFPGWFWDHVLELQCPCRVQIGHKTNRTDTSRLGAWDEDLFWALYSVFLPLFIVSTMRLLSSNYCRKYMELRSPTRAKR